MRRGKNLVSLAVVIVLISVLSACSGVKTEKKYPTGANRATTEGDIYAEPPSIFGRDGIRLLGDKEGTDDSDIGVNAYLWRAALDTVSFMPLASADPFGGTILTDWYNPPESSNERLKLNVFILSKQLRSDGVRVRVFRQVKKGGEWVDAKASEKTGAKMEEAILTRARQLRVSGMGVRD
jgi:hypothetical protein